MTLLDAEIVSPEASRTPVARPPSSTIEATSAPVRISPPFSRDQCLEGGKQVLRAALDDRRAGSFQRKGDDLGDLAGEGVFRAEPGMQHPRRPERAGEFGLVGGFEPAARRNQRLAEEGGKPARTATPGLAGKQLEGRVGPQAAAEQAEQQPGIALDVADIARAVAVARRHALSAATLAARSMRWISMAAVRPAARRSASRCCRTPGRGGRDRPPSAA